MMDAPVEADPAPSRAYWPFRDRPSTPAGWRALRQAAVRALRASRRAGWIGDARAEDFVQEAVARVLAYEVHHAVEAWGPLVVRTAMNIAADEARRRLASPFEPLRPEHEDLPDPAPGPERAAGARLALEQVRHAACRLRPKDERVLRLRAQGKSIREIGDGIDRSVSLVEKTLVASRRQLADWLNGERSPQRPPRPAPVLRPSASRVSGIWSQAESLARLLERRPDLALADLRGFVEDRGGQDCSDGTLRNLIKPAASDGPARTVGAARTALRVSRRWS